GKFLTLSVATTVLHSSSIMEAIKCSQCKQSGCLPHYPHCIQPLDFVSPLRSISSMSDLSWRTPHLDQSSTVSLLKRTKSFSLVVARRWARNWLSQPSRGRSSASRTACGHWICASREATVGLRTAAVGDRRHHRREEPQT